MLHCFNVTGSLALLNCTEIHLNEKRDTAAHKTTFAHILSNLSRNSVECEVSIVCFIKKRIKVTSKLQFLARIRTYRSKTK